MSNKAQRLCIGGPMDGEYVETESEYFVCPVKLIAPYSETEGEVSERPKDVVYRISTLADGPGEPGGKPEYYKVFVCQDEDNRGVIKRLIDGYRPSE